MTSVPRSQGRTLPMPERRARLEIDRTYTREELARIKLGASGHGADAKWFIFWEEDVLHLHRSVSGVCIWQVRLEPEGDGARVAEAWANRDPEEYEETDDWYDCRLLPWVIDYVLLERDVRMPRPRYHPAFALTRVRVVRAGLGSGLELSGDAEGALRRVFEAAVAGRERALTITLPRKGVLRDHAEALREVLGSQHWPLDEVTVRVPLPLSRKAVVATLERTREPPLPYEVT